MARQVIFRQRDEGPADILAGGLRGFAQGRLLRQQQSGNRLTEDLTRRKLAEALRLSGVASEFESGGRQAPEGFIFDPIQQRLVKATPDTQINFSGFEQFLNPTNANIPKTRQQLTQEELGALREELQRRGLA